MKRLAVLGMPVSHSRSPAIHNAAFAALGVQDEWSYEAIEVAPDRFPSRVREMMGEGFVGANVTVPYKNTALLFAHRKSEVAREIGAANTLSFEEGVIRADNTDAEGLMKALPGSPAGRWSSGPAEPRGPWSGRWSSPAPRSGSGTAPPSTRQSSARSWAVARNATPRGNTS